MDTDQAAELIAEMSWAVLDWELRTRFPADWEPPADDYTRRELLAEILTEERTRRLGQ